jgi:hypothetical protein
MQIKFFERYGFYSDLFKYLLEKYYDPIIEREKVKSCNEDLALVLYTINDDATVKGTNTFGYQPSTGDWFYDGHMAYYISWLKLQNLCVELAKNIGYER